MRPARVLSLIAVVGADTRRRDTFVLHTEYHPVGDQKSGQTRFAHRISSCWRPEDGTHSFCTQNITLSETRRWDTFVSLTVSCSFVSSLAPAAAVHAPFCAFLSNSDASVRKREEVRALNLGRASWKTAPCLIKPLPPHRLRLFDCSLRDGSFGINLSW